LSGHSKWANIKHRKAASDAKKGAMYAKMSREIIVAAAAGGSDPAGNFRLRQAIEKAKAEGLPNENIQRAIEKCSGEGPGQELEELTYEGYGPGGVAILIKCATDNRRRTAGDLRSLLNKYGGNLGETGCVSWMFTERGEIKIGSIPEERDEEELLEAALAGGADDIDTSDQDVITVVCNPSVLERVQEAIGKTGHAVKAARTAMHPATTDEINDEDTARKLLRLLDALESHDDTQHVYSNFDMDSQLLLASMS